MFKKFTLVIFLTILTLKVVATHVEAAKLYIEPPTGTYTQGQDFQARIILDTEGQQTAGTDVYLKFDPQILQAQTVQEGTIYITYLGKSIDNNAGTISLSGIISLDADTGYLGTGTFATVVFRGVGVGTSQVTFDYTPGDKNDSNIAVLDLPDDNLTNAIGGTFTIVAASGGPGDGGGDGGDGGNGGNGGNGGGDGGNGGDGKGGPPIPTKAAELPKSGSLGDTLKLVGAGLGTLLASLLLLL